MTLPVRPYAAVAVPRIAGSDADHFLRLVRDSLEHFDATSGILPKVSAQHSAVAADTLMVKVITKIDPDRGARVIFRVAPRPNAAVACLDKSVEILSDIVMRALGFLEATHVEWLDERTRLSPEEFQDSCSYVSPKRARREMVEAPITERSVDEIEKSLARMFDDNPPVDAPGHGKERAKRVAAARKAAEDAVAAKKRDQAMQSALPEADEDAAPDGAYIAADGAEAAPRGSRLGRLFAALPLRRAAHVAALGGACFAFWKAGLFAPILQLVGV